jgi:hypothetical protein
MSHLIDDWLLGAEPKGDRVEDLLAPVAAVAVNVSWKLARVWMAGARQNGQPWGCGGMRPSRRKDTAPGSRRRHPVHETRTTAVGSQDQDIKLLPRRFAMWRFACVLTPFDSA